METIPSHLVVPRTLQLIVFQIRRGGFSGGVLSDYEQRVLQEATERIQLFTDDKDRQIVRLTTKSARLEAKARVRDPPVVIRELIRIFGKKYGIDWRAGNNLRILQRVLKRTLGRDVTERDLETLSHLSWKCNDLIHLNDDWELALREFLEQRFLFGDGVHFADDFCDLEHRDRAKELLFAITDNLGAKFFQESVLIEKCYPGK